MRHSIYIYVLCEGEIAIVLSEGCTFTDQLNACCHAELINYCYTHSQVLVVSLCQNLMTGDLLDQSVNQSVNLFDMNITE